MRCSYRKKGRMRREEEVCVNTERAKNQENVGQFSERKIVCVCVWKERKEKRGQNTTKDKDED